MNVDPAGCPETLASPGQRTTVIAIGGRNQRNVGAVVPCSAICDVGQRNVVACKGNLLAKDAQRGIGTAQCLEAAQAKPGPFILVVQRCNPDAIRQCGQGVQWGRRVTRPTGDLLPCLGKVILGDDLMSRLPIKARCCQMADRAFKFSDHVGSLVPGDVQCIQLPGNLRHQRPLASAQCLTKIVAPKSTIAVVGRLVPANDAAELDNPPARNWAKKSRVCSTSRFDGMARGVSMGHAHAWKRWNRK